MGSDELKPRQRIKGQLSFNAVVMKLLENRTPVKFTPRSVSTPTVFLYQGTLIGNGYTGFQDIQICGVLPVEIACLHGAGLKEWTG